MSAGGVLCALPLLLFAAGMLVLIIWMGRTVA